MLVDELILLSSSVTHIIMGTLSPAYSKRVFSPTPCRSDLSVAAFNAANSGLKLACNHLTSPFTTSILFAGAFHARIIKYEIII